MPLTNLNYPIDPTTQVFSNQSGTYYYNQAFQVLSLTSTPSAGATYTNNSVTFTVTSVNPAGTMVYAYGNGVPTTSGTLTFASGTGPATIVYQAVYVPKYLRVRVQGGGSGGAGSGSSNSGGNGNAGAASSFTDGGATSMTANAGGVGTQATSTHAAGGTATGGDINIAGGIGGPRWADSIAAPGGQGGTSILGMLGAAGEANQTQGSVANGYGGGGGGAGCTATSTPSGGGGGGGGYCEKTIQSPSASYTYVAGGAGGGGGAGSSGVTGGSGSAGAIVVEEHYNY